MATRDPIIYDAIRTPRGRGKPDGALHTVKPVDLVVGLIDELRARHRELDAERIDDLVLGVVTPVGDQGGDIARAAAIKAGLPDAVPGVQVNRFCASGLEAVNLAAAKVASGFEELVLAGGVEAMSRVPMGSDGGPMFNDPETTRAVGYVPQGVSADLLATLEGLGREELDAYALRSHHRAVAAWNEGRFARSVVPVRDLNDQILLARDEHMRPDTTLERLARLEPSFAAAGETGGFDALALARYHWLERIDHLHTPGNSSGIVDGAALVIVGSERAGAEHGLEPRARIVATALAGTDPTLMLTGPAPASAKALAKAGLRIEDIDVIEVNEAFAAVVLRCVRELGADIGRVNVNGGSIALGHPLGATGAILISTALDELERVGGRYGLVTLCVAGGMGIATVVERL